MTESNIESPDRGPVDRGRQWTTGLAVTTSLALLFLTVSGLAIWLLPFSVPSQVLVFLHTAFGVLFLVPTTVYIVRHWLLYRPYQLTHIKLLGYGGVTVLAASALSGVVLTAQALWGRRIDYTWDTVHIVTTFGLLAFVLPHVVVLASRDRKAPDMRPATEAARLHGRAVLVGSLALVGLFVLLVYAYTPVKLVDEFPADYSFKYGQDRPFAPSLASTITGGPYDTRLVSGSTGCGTSRCHEQILAEWATSAHRYSAMDPAFQAIQLNMARQNGPESTRYCGGCHDPISLFSGTKNLYTEHEMLTAPRGYQEGVSCLTCHAIRAVDVQGNANFKIDQPVRYMFELEYDASPSETKRLLRDFVIRAFPQEHVRSLSKTLFKAPEYCAACHKQFVDEEINNVGWVQLQNQYDNWRKSKWNHPGEATRTIECRECHMPLVDSPDPASGDERDYNRTPRDGKHRSHRFLGANQMVPALLKLPGSAEHVGLVQKWLQGKIVIPEIADKWVQGTAVSVELIAPDAVRPGEKMAFKAVVTSNKVGHDFPTGPLDIIQSWVEIIVKDDQGQVVFASGTSTKRGSSNRARSSSRRSRWTSTEI